MKLSNAQLQWICRERAKRRARTNALLGIPKPKPRRGSRARAQSLALLLADCPFMTAAEIGRHFGWRSRDVQAALARALDARAIIALPPSDGHPMPRYLTPAPKKAPAP